MPLSGVAKHENFKVIADDPPNDTDVDASLQQIKDNDAKLKELNLNNIKVGLYSKHIVLRLIKAVSL